MQASPVMVRVFLAVSSCALAGMVLGGAFGYAAGRLAPTFFTNFLPWENLEPVGTATFLGGTAGVLLGGGLGVFGVLVQLLALWWREQRRKN